MNTFLDETEKSREKNAQNDENDDNSDKSAQNLGYKITRNGEVIFYDDSHDTNSGPASTSTAARYQHDLSVSKEQRDTERRREKKWLDMFSKWDYWNNKGEHTKERTRKGIPESLRGVFWPLFAEANIVRTKAYEKMSLNFDAPTDQLTQAQLVAQLTSLSKSELNASNIQRHGSFARRMSFSTNDTRQSFLSTSMIIQPPQTPGGGLNSNNNSLLSESAAMSSNSTDVSRSSLQNANKTPNGTPKQPPPPPPPSKTPPPQPRGIPPQPRNTPNKLRNNGSNESMEKDQDVNNASGLQSGTDGSNNSGNTNTQRTLGGDLSSQSQAMRNSNPHLHKLASLNETGMSIDTNPIDYDSQTASTSRSSPSSRYPPPTQLLMPGESFGLVSPPPLPPLHVHIARTSSNFDAQQQKSIQQNLLNGQKLENFPHNLQHSVSTGLILNNNNPHMHYNFKQYTTIPPPDSSHLVELDDDLCNGTHKIDSRSTTNTTNTTSKLSHSGSTTQLSGPIGDGLQNDRSFGPIDENYTLKTTLHIPATPSNPTNPTTTKEITPPVPPPMAFQQPPRQSRSGPQQNPFMQTFPQKGDRHKTHNFSLHLPQTPQERHNNTNGKGNHDFNSSSTGIGGGDGDSSHRYDDSNEISKNISENSSKNAQNNQNSVENRDDDNNDDYVIISNDSTLGLGTTLPRTSIASTSTTDFMNVITRPRGARVQKSGGGSVNGSQVPLNVSEHSNDGVGNGTSLNGDHDDDDDSNNSEVQFDRNGHGMSITIPLNDGSHLIEQLNTTPHGGIVNSSGIQQGSSSPSHTITGSIEMKKHYPQTPTKSASSVINVGLTPIKKADSERVSDALSLTASQSSLEMSFFSYTINSPDDIQPSWSLYTRLASTPSQYDRLIGKDVKRTFASHVLFSVEALKSDQTNANNSTKTRARQYLADICRAYCHFDQDLGYCQGISFLVATLLMYMEAEDAFWVLVSLLQHPRYNLRGLFTIGFPLLNEYIYIIEELMKKVDLKLYRHLKSVHFSYTVCVPQWFMGLFVYALPLSIGLRIWDCLFYEGPKILVRTALFLILSFRKQLLAEAELDGVLSIVCGDLPNAKALYADADAFMKGVQKINITTDDIKKLSMEWQGKQDKTLR
jgi:hypothetical protein